MPDSRFPCSQPGCGGGSGKENICIEANRIFDSCRDRDCFENTPVFLTDLGREIIEHTSNIRIKSAEIAWTYITIDPIQFNCGFYSVNIRFYCKLEFEACLCPGHSQEFCGVAVLEKRVILYGGDSSVSIFRSNGDFDFCHAPEPCDRERNVPVVVVETVAPVILDVKVLEIKHDCCCCCCTAGDIPERITSRLDGALSDYGINGRYLAISLGIFSVIRIIRPAQYMINATEYAIPDKECVQPDSDDPCGTFRSMPFPTSEFSANTLGRHNGEGRGKCGCS